MIDVVSAAYTAQLGIGGFRHLRGNPVTEPKSYTKVVEESDDLVAFDVVMVDGDGEICYYAKKCYFRRINL